MKKAKIMLTSIAIVAVVGGALAFNAKKHSAYCTAPGTPPEQNATTDQNCSNFVASTDIGALNLVYEIPTNGSNCNGVVTCTAFPLKAE